VILKTDLTVLNRNIDTAHARATDECVGEARRNAPVSVSRGIKLNAGSVQGGLRASLTYEASTPRKGRFGSPLRYAMMREKGGTIVPVRARLLHWIDPVTGEHRFAKRVVQRPGGPRQGYKSFIGPAGDRYPEFMHDHLEALG
jgi:hypothetical protein